MEIADEDPRNNHLHPNLIASVADCALHCISDMSQMPTYTRI